MAGTSLWQLDPAHSSVEFSVKHMMMTTVRGRFRDFRGTVTIDEANPDNSRVEVELDCEFEGSGKDPWGNDRLGFGATGELDRRD